ncbi:hypothetical protein A0J61_07984 [Choanephora cucurbitarum]|uniref:Homeobox domain-containing protein n=1 Tax=Choanephora cucurbitarum TaxID=101091 RepID=A0A1C7N5Q6_9FUNG|nr:hypothetical protein A0J61_07984 [Choanephora cucurbitarum]
MYTDYQQLIMSNTHDSYVPDLTAYIKQELPQSPVPPTYPSSLSSSSPHTHLSDNDDSLAYALNEVYLEEMDAAEYQHPSAETILFFEILQEYPDLSSFIGHKDSMTFCHLWLKLQQAISSARQPQHRPRIQAWLKSAALQIHFLLVSIVKSNPGNNDMTSEPRCMFSAFRRLKDRIEIVHQVFQLIENGRVWFNQSPLEAIQPLVDAASQIKENMSYFSDRSNAIPVMGDTSDHVTMVNPDSVSLEDLSNHTIHTYNMMPYDAPLVQTSWSLPVTPSCADYRSFSSLPTSPTCAGAFHLTSGDHPSSFESDIYDWPSPIRSVSEAIGDLTTQVDEDDYVASETETEEEEENAKKKKRSNQPKASLTGRTRKERTERRYTRRTATSYDAQTTHYLKTVFFSIYSSREKLTKEQRRQVQKETGLKPRNITYWFSNHKRRFQTSLAVFKRVVDQSGGQVKTYDDFLAWRRQHGLPEEVSEEELEDDYHKTK